MRFKRFTKHGFLKGIGRDLLSRFFRRHAEDLAAKGIALPDDNLQDDPYFKQLSQIRLPERSLQPDSPD